jgi:hypothetical protein
MIAGTRASACGGNSPSLLLARFAQLIGSLHGRRRMPAFARAAARQAFRRSGGAMDDRPCPWDANETRTRFKRTPVNLMINHDNALRRPSDGLSRQVSGTAVRWNVAVEGFIRPSGGLRGGSPLHIHAWMALRLISSAGGKVPY